MKNNKIISQKFVGKPLFLIGSGRSGTTLLQRILNSVEEVSIWGEHGGFLKTIAESYYKFEHKNVINNLNTKKSPINSLNYIKDIKNWSAWSNPFGKEEIKSNFKRFVGSFFCFEPFKLYWGFKEIRYGSGDKVLYFLKDLFPNSKFIFIVRNPLDVLASQVSVFKKNDKSSLIKISTNWANQNEGLLGFYHNNPDECFLVKYEDIVTPTGSCLRELFDFLELDLTSKQSEVLNLKSGRGQDPHSKKRVGLFTKEEIKTIINVVGSTAKKLGYNLTEDYFDKKYSA